MILSALRFAIPVTLFILALGGTVTETRAQGAAAQAQFPGERAAKPAQPKKDATKPADAKKDSSEPKQPAKKDTATSDQGKQPAPKPEQPDPARQPEEPAPPAPPTQQTTTTPPGTCLKPAEVHDGDGDFERNAKELSSDKLCITQEVFSEGGLKWVLQIIRKKGDSDTVLWVVPHDNEDSAFDAAVYGVQKHGGTIVAVETAGERFNGRQDPNRNFNKDPKLKCREQVAASPLYTESVVGKLKPHMKIIALHSNERGYAGDGKGGGGGISIAKPLSGTSAFRGAKSIGAKSPDDTMIFVASSERRADDPALDKIVKNLNDAGVNVLYELVSRARNDCSLSNYAALNKIRDYINIEVVHKDAETQKRIIDIALNILPKEGIGPIVKPAPEDTPVAQTPDPKPPAASGTPAPPSEPVPVARPAPAPAKEQPRDQVAVAVPPPAPNVQQPAPAITRSSIVAQVGSWKEKPTDHSAEITWDAMVKKLPMLKDYGRVIRPIENGRYGLFAGPFKSKDDADNFCNNLLNNRKKKGDTGGRCGDFELKNGSIVSVSAR